MKEVKEYLKKEYPKFNGFIEHTLVAEMAMNFAKYYHTKQLGLSEVIRQSEQLACKHKMTRNPKENQENKCRLCGLPYKT